MEGGERAHRREGSTAELRERGRVEGERRAVRRGREGATPCDKKERAGAGETFDARMLT